MSAGTLLNSTFVMDARVIRKSAFGFILFIHSSLYACF